VVTVLYFLAALLLAWFFYEMTLETLFRGWTLISGCRWGLPSAGAGLSVLAAANQLAPTDSPIIWVITVIVSRGVPISGEGSAPSSFMATTAARMQIKTVMMA
jgi:hypothetical protein